MVMDFSFFLETEPEFYEVISKKKAGDEINYAQKELIKAIIHTFIDNISMNINSSVIYFLLRKKDKKSIIQGLEYLKRNTKNEEQLVLYGELINICEKVKYELTPYFLLKEIRDSLEEGVEVFAEVKAKR